MAIGTTAPTPTRDYLDCAPRFHTNMMAVAAAATLVLSGLAGLTGGLTGGLAGLTADLANSPAVRHPPNALNITVVNLHGVNIARIRQDRRRIVAEERLWVATAAVRRQDAVGKVCLLYTSPSPRDS